MQWKTVFIILFIFLMGFATGLLTTGYITKNRFIKDKHKPKHELFMRHMGKELDLSKEQKKKIHPIVRSHMESREATRKAFRAEDMAHMKQVPDLIKDNLDDSQYQSLQKLIEDLSKRGRRHPPPPPPPEH